MKRLTQLWLENARELEAAYRLGFLPARQLAVALAALGGYGQSPGAANVLLHWASLAVAGLRLESSQVWLAQQRAEQACADALDAGVLRAAAREFRGVRG